jgi:phosphate transport system protein
MHIAVDVMTHAHTDRSYERELEQIREHLGAMGAEVCTMLTGSLRALASGDRDSVRGIITADKIVNRYEVEVDEMCLTVLARRQPVASDLRFVATALKLDTDLERIGDLCVNLCERILQLLGPLDAETTARLANMGARVRSMIEDALRAFATWDATLAESVLEADATVDKAYADTADAAAGRIRRDPRAVHDGLRLRSMARYLERMGDHATNLAEMVIFMVDGRDVRHPGRLEDRRPVN